MNSKVRTDLALEAHEQRLEDGENAAEGVTFSRKETGIGAVTELTVCSPEGEKALGKPRGRYITVELDALLRRREDAFADTCGVLSGALRSLLGGASGGVLVAGLGNRDITPDAIGPGTVDHLLVTRHLRAQLPEFFGSFRSVSAVCSGVLGTTGIESGDVIAALCARLQPELVIAVDALASRRADRLCRTVQLSDTGIIPGSGVGNARQALSRDTLGVPVIAVGVPTVVDAAALACTLARQSGCTLDPDSFGGEGGMIVTPRDIDKSVRDISRLLGYSINLALHDGLGIADVDMLLS